MNIKNWLDKAEKTLRGTSGTARLDAEVLLADALDKDKSWLYAHPEQEIEPIALIMLNSQLKRRVLHEPLAYIRGKTEFYGREFLVDKHVLVPRPESETIVDLLKQVVDSRQLTVDSELKIIDVGTGSGALAISAKLEIPRADVLAIDIDPNCLKVAKKNAKKHNVKIEFLQSDLLTPLSTVNCKLSTILGNLLAPLSTVNCKLSTILANLPYIPTDYSINQAATHEPKLAIFGGPDGLDLYRLLFDQLSKFTVDSLQLTVLTESLDFQHAELTKIAKIAGYKQTEVVDLIQVFETVNC